MVQEVEDFYGVYLLVCQNPKYKGRTYIGYTVNPNRRIKQHNTGAHAGGAYRTSGKGPWEMVLIVHGFPNDICGLRFEWAWQNPKKSRRLRYVSDKSRKESAFQYRWRVVCNMLRTAPWSGLGLSIRWLKQEFRLDFLPGLEPPLHMPIVFGPVVSKRVAGSQKGTSRITPSQMSQPAATDSGGVTTPAVCAVCVYTVMPGETMLRCLRLSCKMVAHIRCLARYFLSDQSQILPVNGTCPQCQVGLVWGDLIRQHKGCYSNLSESTLQADDESGQVGIQPVVENAEDEIS